MFIRKNKNRSGSISVQIISKNEGRYKLIETIGSGKTREEIFKLSLEAQARLSELRKQPSLFIHPNELSLLNFLENLSNRQIRTIGPELIFGALFDYIGFNQIKNDLFRHLVITRLAYPGSKLKTIDYLKRYQNISISKDMIYRFMDRLYNRYQDQVERIAFNHTKKVLKGSINFIFYDMTTLYFEVEDEDDLRKFGYSKDGKFNRPQIMLGLLVSDRGLPISYDIYQGNTYEGYTLVPVLAKIRKKYGLGNPTIVADAGLLSKDNLDYLKENKYLFIVGARIKNESAQITKKILIKAPTMKDNDYFSIRKPDQTKLIITYSDKRAKLNKRYRDKGLKRLRKEVESGKLKKEHINHRGYNKFLSLTGEVNIAIDEQKIIEDQKWDGLKGYITNSRLPARKVVASYGHLWQIEKAFRISKTDLRVRPIYHNQEKRIEAHICIAFAAYAIFKELEQLLIKYKIEMSPKRAAELTHNMYGVDLLLPKSQKKKQIIFKMDKEQEILQDCIRKHVLI